MLSDEYCSAVHLRRRSGALCRAVQLVNVNAIMVILQPVVGGEPRRLRYAPRRLRVLLLVLVMQLVLRHGRGGAAKPEGELEGVAQDASKPGKVQTQKHAGLSKK